MKAESFVKTGEEKYQASESLLSTEKTDAINSGIVEGGESSLSRSSRHGYSPSAQQSRHKAKARNADVIRDRKDADRVGGEESHGGHEQSNVHGGYEQGSGHIASDNKVSQKFSSKHALKKSLDGSFAQTMRKGVHKALDDSELEGIDDAYYRGKRAYHAPRTFKSAVHTGKTVLAKVAGKQSATKTAASATSATQNQVRAQAHRYFKKSVYKQAATQNITRQFAVKKMFFPGVKAGMGKLVFIASPVFIGIILAFLSALLLVAAISNPSNEEYGSGSFGQLSGVQLEVAQALRAGGLDNVQIAAIMGNISGESGWNPAAEYHRQGNNTAYEYGYGLFQFTDTKQGVGNYSNYKKWAEANGKALDSAAAQTEYFMNQLPSSWSTGLHASGYYALHVPQYTGKSVSYSSWLKEPDLGLATYAFLACYERPADWAAGISYPKRFAEAQKFYNQLTTGGGELEASTEVQQAILAATKRTPFTGAGWCAMWVNNVYQNAGLPRPVGNANDLYRNFAHNSDRSQLKVGMVVAVERSSAGGAEGWKFGHVGIYIGNGQVMHNSLSLEITSLDDWINTFAKYSPAGWGFPPSVSVSQ
ncbi:phage tail tip lysozyme [Arcanobacterium hippocoleae]|nr:phage tail tip lysozyme [Arcanobacterium hippocoleae]